MPARKQVSVSSSDKQVKTVVLAGGMGTRLAEETETRPKPMVEVGGRPMLWHILKYYSFFGFSEFLLALGYKGDVIKRYFIESFQFSGSMSLDLASGSIQRYDKNSESWLVHCVETGLETSTGGRLKRLKAWLGNATFMLTYGDGVANVNLTELLQFHRRHGRIATVTAVRPPSRYGGLVLDGAEVCRFTEKPQSGERWINGGFCVFEPEIFAYIKDDETSLETDVLERLARDRQLTAYRHHGFWQCMDTLRDKRLLESLWQQGRAPWRMCA